LQVARDIQAVPEEWHGRLLSWRRTAGASVEVMEAMIEPSPELKASGPRLVYTHNLAAKDAATLASLSFDMRRVAAFRTTGPSSPPQINLILNWVDDLRQKLK